MWTKKKFESLEKHLCLKWIKHLNSKLYEKYAFHVSDIYVTKLCEKFLPVIYVQKCSTLLVLSTRTHKPTNPI